MEFNRRQLMTTLAAGLAWGASGCHTNAESEKSDNSTSAPPLRSAAGDVDWRNANPLPEGRQ
jgi:hypothetical protein